MRLPFVSRFAYEEMKAMLVARAERAEAEQARLLNKMLRLSVGGDGEDNEPRQHSQYHSQPVEAPVEVESELAEARKATGSKHWSVLKNYIVRQRAKKFIQIRNGVDSPQSAAAAMEEAFEEGIRG